MSTTKLVLEFLAASNATGKFGDGRPYDAGYLFKESSDCKTIITGDFQTEVVYFTRSKRDEKLDSRNERTFKPGLFIKWNDGKYNAPDVQHEQLMDAIMTTQPAENGIIRVDLTAIQRQNQSDPNFPKIILIEKDHTRHCYRP